MIRGWFFGIVALLVFSGFSGCSERTHCEFVIKAIETNQPLHLTAPPTSSSSDFLNAEVKWLKRYGISIPATIPTNMVEQCAAAMYAVSQAQPNLSPDDLALELLDIYAKQWDVHSGAFSEEIALGGLMREDFGFSIERSKFDNRVRVRDVIVGSPAHNAGLNIGILVTAINHTPITRLGEDQLEDAISPKRFEKLVLTVGEPRQSREVTVLRARYHVEAFQPDISEIAYIRVRGLVTAESSIARDLYSARRSEALILDLRDVNGGELQATKEIADALTGGTVLAGFLEPRHGNRMTIEKLNPNSLWDKPVVVLVNSGTKSSAEVLAGALQDYGAIVVGTRTFGKGTNQITIPLQDYGMNGRLAITTSFIVRPSGKLIQFAGVTPDVTLPSASPGKETFENMYSGAIAPPKLPEVPLGDYDRSEVPFRSFTYRMKLQSIEQHLSNAMNRYALGQTTEEQYVEAARLVAKMLAEGRGKRNQPELPFGVRTN